MTVRLLVDLELVTLGQYNLRDAQHRMRLGAEHGVLPANRAGHLGKQLLVEELHIAKGSDTGRQYLSNMLRPRLPLIDA